MVAVSAHSGCGKWSLPSESGPGEWMPEIKGIELCVNGYHACREQDLVTWLGPAIYELEYDPACEYIEGDDKVVCGRARLVRKLDTWNERTARLFACDCAESVVRLCGNDGRPREAIRVARLFADGKATKHELKAAGVSAALSAEDARIAACAAGYTDGYTAGDAAEAAASATNTCAGTGAFQSTLWSAWATKSAARAVMDEHANNLFAYLRGEKC